MSFLTTFGSWLYDFVLGIDVPALLFAVLVPFLIIYVNHEIRFRRLRMIDDYDNSFRTRLSVVNQKENNDNETGNPTFEYVKSKYISDIRDEEITRRAGSKTAQWPTSEKIQDLLAAPPSFFRLTANRRLMFAAVCFALITYFGFAVSFERISCFVSTGACSTSLQNLVFVGGIGAPSADALRFGEQVLTVAALAFLGAYIATIRELLRRMAVFDLSSFTFLKQAAETLASVLGVVFLFRALPDPVGQVTSMVSNETWQPAARISLLWLAMAPLFGLFPESATKYLFIRFRQYFQWIKSEDNRFTEVTMITPLDVIDGIDYWTRIRLEQSGIADVQALATYNPIMLFIETPYGIYQVFDWIAQAQLCHIVGVEKFLIFRELNIRTIFDLERAVLSKASPEQYDQIYGGILLAPTASLKRTSAIASTNFILPGSDPGKVAGINEYCQWAYGALSVHDKAITLAIEHMIRWITDDLHVRRLRRLWIEISKSLGPESEMLPDGKPLPV
ncbi:MAG: putative rane protein [Rhizobium sp.]|nr:putative rane protein [Rhizobium sp.]